MTVKNVKPVKLLRLKQMKTMECSEYSDLSAQFLIQTSSKAASRWMREDTSQQMQICTPISRVYTQTGDVREELKTVVTAADGAIATVQVERSMA